MVTKSMSTIENIFWLLLIAGLGYIAMAAGIIPRIRIF